MHDARPGKTLFILERRWGNDGYAFWFKLLEILTASDGHVFNLNNPQDCEYFWARMGLSGGISGPEILDLLASLGNIDADLWKLHKVIWCQNLVDRLSESVWAKRGRSAPTKPSMNGNISGPEIQAETDNWPRNTSKRPENGISGPEVHRGSEGVEGVRDAELTPLSATPALQENPQEEVSTKVDTLISRLHDVEPGLLVGREQHLELEQLAGAVDADTIVDCFRHNQRQRQPKPLKYFLTDFSSVRGAWEKVRPAQSKPRQPEEPKRPLSEEETAAIKAQAAAAGNRALKETSPPKAGAPEDDALAEVLF